MVCPLCVVGAGAIITGNALGIPTEYTTFLFGMVTMTLALITQKALINKYKVFHPKLLFYTTVLAYTAVAFITIHTVLQNV